MKAIRYSLHFTLLIVAVVVLYLARDLTLLARVFNFNFFPVGLMGVLHAAAIVVSLRDRKAVHSISALSFIILAAVWSAAIARNRPKGEGNIRH